MIAEKIDLSKYIEMRNDRPHIRGRKLPIMFLISFQKANKASVDNLCYNYTLTEVQVLAALLYYQENKEQLDLQEQLDNQEEKELFDRYARDQRK